MDSASRLPDPRLRGLVAPYVGYHQDDARAGTHHGLPDTTLTLVLAFDAPLDVAWATEPAARSTYWAMVAGLHTGPALISHAGFQHGVQLALTPAGARALLGLPAAALHQEMVPLAELLGARADRLYDEVAGATSWHDRFDVLDARLVDLLDRRDGCAVRPELDAVWRWLHRLPATRVEELAAGLGWSRRHLTSAFAAEFGIGPKAAARLVRFQGARSALVRGRPLSEVASVAGFSDQAHLTREWRRLAGRTPVEWLREERPFVQDVSVEPVEP